MATPIKYSCGTCLHLNTDCDDEPCRSCPGDEARESAVKYRNVASDGTNTGAIKHDANKPRYDLIPPEPLDGLARLYALGAKKYADRNWERGMQWSRIFAAMMRHAWKWFRGETYDEQDGQHHLLSVIWCAMALYTYQAREAGEDDRPQNGILPETYDTVWQQTR